MVMLPEGTRSQWMAWCCCNTVLKEYKIVLKDMIYMMQGLLEHLKVKQSSNQCLY
jgi:hypothetical protein